MRQSRYRYSGRSQPLLVTCKKKTEVFSHNVIHIVVILLSQEMVSSENSNKFRVPGFYRTKDPAWKNAEIDVCTHQNRRLASYCTQKIYSESRYINKMETYLELNLECSNEFSLLRDAMVCSSSRVTSLSGFTDLNMAITYPVFLLPNRNTLLGMLWVLSLRNLNRLQNVWTIRYPLFFRWKQTKEEWIGGERWCSGWKGKSFHLLYTSRIDQLLCMCKSKILVSMAIITHIGLSC